MLEVSYTQFLILIAIMDQNHNKYKGEMESVVGTGELIKNGLGEMQFYDGSNYNGCWN